MAVSFHATSGVAVSGNGATSNSVTWPANSINDIALLMVASTVNIATPAGWTLVASDTAVSNGQIFVYWQLISSVQSGSFTLTQPAGITQIAINTYTGAKNTAPAAGEYIMHRMGVNTTAISTQSSITYENFGLQVVVGPPAYNISLEACNNTGWTMTEEFDQIFGGVPSLAMADGPMSTGGPGTMTAIGGGSVNWAILGLTLKVPSGGGGGGGATVKNLAAMGVG